MTPILQEISDSLDTAIERSRAFPLMLAALRATDALLVDPDAGDIDADRVHAVVRAAIDAATGAS